MSTLFQTTRTNILRRLRKWFLTGILVIAPVAITIYLIYLVIDTTDYIVQSLLPGTYTGRLVPGLGLVLTLSVITLIGIIASNYFGNKFVALWDRLIQKMPLINGIYTSTKQLFETVLSDQKKTFKQVVLVQFPHNRAWSIGFVTGSAQSFAGHITEEPLLAVYVPTTPIPTSGFMLVVPESSLLHTRLSVEEGLKLVVSGGLVAPPETIVSILPDEQIALLDDLPKQK